MLYLFRTVIFVVRRQLGLTATSWRTCRHPRLYKLCTIVYTSSGARTNLKLGGGTCQKNLSCPPLFGSTSAISRFGEPFRNGQYSLVSFLFAVFLLMVPPCPAICKSGGRENIPPPPHGAGAGVYKCLHGVAPSYLTEMCQPVSSVSGRRCLRSSARGDLAVPRTKTSTYGTRSLAVSGPTSWN